MMKVAAIVRKGLLAGAVAQAIWAVPLGAQAEQGRPAAAPSAAGSGLRAGAARVDITPALADLPKPFIRVADPLFVRSLVLESGDKRAVLVVGDLPTIATDVLRELTGRIAQAAGAPVENVMLAVTHTHNAVRLDRNPVGIILPGSAKVTAITGDAIVRSVQQAAAALRPARMGYGTGQFRLAAPRNDGPPAADPAPMTSEIGVLRVDGVDGEPIAALVNGGPEPVMAMGMKDTVTSDVAGAVERYVEQRYGDKAVVLYTVGSPPGVALNARRAIPGTTPADPRALIAATGTVLGEEVLAASQRVKLSGSVSIEGMLREIECPGKITTPLNTPTSCSDAPGATLPKCVFTTKDGPPVKLRMGVIRIGDMAIVHSDANISAVVWDEVQRQAPAGTILVALGYGPVHYVMEDAAYPSNSYPVTASMVKPGCAAPGFVSTSLGMLRRR